MVVLSFFLCYNAATGTAEKQATRSGICFSVPVATSKPSAKQKKERGSAGLRVCTRRGQRRRANLLRSRRRSAEARVCEYAPEGGRGEEQTFCEAEEGARKRGFASMHPKGGRGEEQSYCEAEEGARKRRFASMHPKGAEEKSKATAKQKKERGKRRFASMHPKGAEEKSKATAKQKKERGSAGDGRGDFTWRKKKDSVFIKREKR